MAVTVICTSILVDWMELYPHSRCLARGPEGNVYFVYLLSFMMGKIVGFYSNCRLEIVL
jgi:hypothetical protein